MKLSRSELVILIANIFFARRMLSVELERSFVMFHVSSIAQIGTTESSMLYLDAAEVS